MNRFGPGRWRLGAALIVWACGATALAQGGPASARVAPPPPSYPVSQCVVPAKPGGGFDLTCQLARRALTPDRLNLRIAYHPGGIGALVYNEVVHDVRRRDQEIIAFSTGSLLNLAQGRFGRHQPERIRWVAALAMDHGVVAVHRDAPWKDLQALLAALKTSPADVTFGASGTIGSQDWMKSARLAQAAGVSHKAIRVVACEGGGDAMQALQGRHVQVLCGDAAEGVQQIQRGAPLRVLAVMTDQRLKGPLAQVPTTHEQGVALSWPIVRGVYTDSRQNEDVLAAMERGLMLGRQRPEFERQLMQLGLQPIDWDAATLTQWVDRTLEKFRAEAAAFGLLMPGR